MCVCLGEFYVHLITQVSVEARRETQIPWD